MSKDSKSTNVMRQIDENLRRVYMENQDDDVPDRFKVLLEKLKSQGSGAKDQTDDS